jgi:two-component system sensor histidine kinase RegB
VATQAAGTAHELNTPLASMRLLLGELRREYAGSGALADDLALLETQVDRCSGILHDMAAFGREQLAQVPEQTRLGKLLDDALDRLRLLRPQVEATCSVDENDATLDLRVPAGLRHALLNLLDNAADASAQRGSDAVRLGAHLDGDWLELLVGDDGPGFGHAGPVRFGESDKQDGLGLGLALAEATAERLGGEMRAIDDARGGEIHLRLPLSALS